MRLTILALFMAAVCGTGCQSTPNDDPQRPVNPNAESPGKGNPTEMTPARQGLPAVRPLGTSS